MVDWDQGVFFTVDDEYRALDLTHVLNIVISLLGEDGSQSSHKLLHQVLHRSKRRNQHQASRIGRVHILLPLLEQLQGDPRTNRSPHHNNIPLLEPQFLGHVLIDSPSIIVNLFGGSRALVNTIPWILHSYHIDLIRVPDIVQQSIPIPYIFPRSMKI